MSEKLELVLPPGESVKYEYTCFEGRFILTTKGRLFRLTDVGQEMPWYKERITKKPLIPAKRRSFVSLIKQSIRDGDYK